MQEDKKTTGFDQFRHWLKANLYIGVGKSLLLWFLAISFVPLASMSFINYLYAYLGLTVVAEKSIVTTSQLRVEYLNTFFRELNNFTEIESEQSENLDFFKELRKQYERSSLSSEAFTHSQSWKEFTQKKRKDFGQYINKQGYYDIYYIDREGNILFSIREEKDLGTNLFKGEYANTLFSQTARESLRKEKILFSDISFYPPSNDVPTGFFCNVLKDPGGEILGIFAVQITMERINNIIQDDVGLGETGQAYLVGADLLMRSATRLEDQDIILQKTARTDKTLEWQQYVRNRDDQQYIISNDLLAEKITSYPNLSGNYVLGIYRNIKYLEQYGVNWALIEEIDNNEAYAYAQDLSDIAKISFIVTIIIVFFIAILVTKKFVSPIKALSAWAKQVAIGDLVRKDIRTPRNEVGEMVDNFNLLVDSLRSYARVSESAAFGDYTRSVIIRSEKDVLGKSMNQMVESFRKVVEQANQIAQGNYSTNVTPRSEIDTLGIALFEMTKTLRHTSREISEQDWLKSGISQLEGKLSGLKDIRKLSSEIISFLVRYLDAQIGLIYISEKNILNLASSYAFKSDNKKYQKVEFGEGLIGQVALDKNTLLLSDPESNLPEIQLGPESKKNVHYMIAPFIFEGQVMGVIQIGSLQEFTELSRIFIERCLDRIAIAVNTVQAHSRVENLLEHTQEQAAELQSQQEELRQTNEELEEQTKALKLSEENLKSQQEELRVINEELEERTNDLELERDNIRKKNEELKKAQEEIRKKAQDLEMASKYKSEFMANMSHELRTPLNSILVLSQLLADNKKMHLSDKEIEYARTINSSGSDLLDLINEILDLSKVESGKLDLHIEAMYPNEVKEYIIRNFKPMMDEKGLELKVDIEKGTPKFVYTDAQRVLQVIKNFISNAIKFTAEGSITLHIFKAQKDLAYSNEGLKEKEVVGISIIDTGIGIAEDKKQLIFEAFQQADGTTSRRYGGTGAGAHYFKKLRRAA
ncbi:MAG: histidine kinase dimerization/phospho-acceptor domain-containing protein [Bacteroidota bacterium]|nr:histidine kinase dimerization/phospho-acceptor domain-containing protein [Bacteroidota bacterium]